MMLFVVIVFDGVMKCGFVVRYKDGFRTRYGYDERGAFVFVFGDDFENGDVLEELCVGRFIFGYGYVKLMEYGVFWKSVKSIRAGSFVKAAYGEARFVLCLFLGVVKMNVLCVEVSVCVFLLNVYVLLVCCVVLVEEKR